MIEGSSPKHRIFVPSDFSRIIQHVPEGCPLVGGQAVAWWQQQYCPLDNPITSCDIDFWGHKADLDALGKALGQTPVYPDKREMSVWVGGILLRINGEKTVLEFIHTVKTSLLTANRFIKQLRHETKVKHVLWNVERLIAASQYKPYRRLQETYEFEILSAVPSKQIQETAESDTLPEEERSRLQKFHRARWPQVTKRASAVDLGRDV